MVRDIIVTPPANARPRMILGLKQEDTKYKVPVIRNKQQIIDSDSDSDTCEDVDDGNDSQTLTADDLTEILFLLDDDQATPADEKLPLDVMNRFNGKTREDLIRVLVTQQATIESQGKKISDLETYIDTLLSKVIEVAPVVLQKDIRNANRSE